jgi:tRNA threonylcarbamoyladenosine biosynthesis protein TsaB
VHVLLHRRRELLVILSAMLAMMTWFGSDGQRTLLNLHRYSALVLLVAAAYQAARLLTRRVVERDVRTPEQFARARPRHRNLRPHRLDRRGRGRERCRRTTVRARPAARARRSSRSSTACAAIAAWTPADLNELYVSAGPGSFTGLRIGITLAKTMALATRVKLVAVPTVRVLVENAPPEARHVVLVLDAKREQIFTARFERDEQGGWVECEPAHLDSLVAMLERAPRPVHLLGEGIPYHEKFLPRADSRVIVTPTELWRPRARVVAEIGGQLARAGQFSDPDRFAPIYIRKPEAEEKWEQLQAKK